MEVRGGGGDPLDLGEGGCAAEAAEGEAGGGADAAPLSVTGVECDAAPRGAPQPPEGGAVGGLGGEGGEGEGGGALLVLLEALRDAVEVRSRFRAKTGLLVRLQRLFT